MSLEKKTLFCLLSSNKYIIFGFVGFLSIQNLLHSVIFKINFPYSVDFTDVFTPVFNFLIHNESTLLTNKGIHILLFPKLIALPNLYLNSFDVVNTLYLLWIIASVTILFFYLILKQTDKKLIWTIIPISAFVYSPLTNSAYFMLTMLEWYSAMLGVVIVIYFLNKKVINLKSFSISVFFAIFSTFSILLGVVAWIAGLLMLIKFASFKKLDNKKWIISWIFSSIIVGLCYLTLTSGMTEKTHLELLFSTTGFSFITNFVASSFRLKYETLMLLVGSASFFFSVIFTLYLIKKECLKQYFPWFTFLFVAFCGSIITALGRMQFTDHLGNEPYYSTISQFFQIGLLVLTAKILSDFLNNPKTLKRKFVVLILILLLLSQMVLLIPSYYSGWQRGQYYFDEKSEVLSCYSLFVNEKCFNTLSKLASNDESLDFLAMINYLIQNKLSIFGEKDFNSKYKIPNEIFQDFEMIDNSSPLGEITHINGINVENESSIEITNEIIQINGWFDQTYSNSYSVLIQINNNPFAFYDDFPVISTVDNNPKNSNWSVSILSGYIPDGCNSIKFSIIDDKKKIDFDNDVVLCKNQL